MSIILKQELANSVPTPPSGKGTLFLDENNSFAVKNDEGNIQTFPTTGGANTQVFYNDEGGIVGSPNFTWVNSSNTLTVLNGNVVATGIKTDNLYYANGNPWDLQEAAGSNNQIQFNLGNNFAASANFTFNPSTNLLSVAGNIAGDNVNAGNLLTANYVSGTLTTAAQPNVTSVGTLTSLAVTGNISGGNVTTGGVLSAVGNVSGGNINTTGIVSATGNVSGGNLTTAGAVAATGNVSGGNLSTGGTLSVTGNANVGNLGAAQGVFTANVTAANVSGGNVVSANYLTGTLTTASQPNITTVGSLTNLSVSGNAVITGNLTVDGNVTYVNVDSLAVEDPVISLGNGPNGAPLTTNDGKDRGTLLNYYTTAPVDAFMGWDNSNAEFAFGSNVSITNDVVTFNTLGNLRAGNFIGNGAALTALTGGNVTGQVANALVAGTVYTAAQPNITSVGTLSTLAVSGNLSAGNISTGGTVTATGNVSGDYIIGNGAFLTGIDATAIQNGSANVRTFANANVTISAAGNANIVVVTGTGANVNGTLTVTGNVSGNVFSGNGSGLSAIAGANVTGQVANALVAGTVYTAAQPNITSVGTLTSLAVTGNANVGNIGATNGVFTNVSGNGAALSAITGANVTGEVAYAATANSVAGANVSGQVANALVAGTVYTAAQPNITSVGTLTSLAVTGNVSAGNVTGANLVSANFVTGTLTTAAQPNITSVGTLGSLTVTNKVTAGQLQGEGGNISNIQGANVSGAVAYATTANAVAGANVSGQVGNALVAGTVYTAAQPNITSVGTLTSLAVTGNVSAGNVSGTLLTGTLTTAAQPNITSVGTLSSLGVTGNISGANLIANTKLVTDAINNKSGNLVVTTNSNVVFSTTGVIDAGSSVIANVGTPTSDADAATKAYVDNMVSSGIHYHTPVRVESPTALNATYNNGTAGVGATLTNAGSNVALSIDGVSLSVADRVLVYTQANAVHNGVYVVSTVGDGSTAWVLTRSDDTDTYSPSTSDGLDEGSYFFVQEGATGAGESYVCNTVGTITFGTTPITFAQFSKAPIYTAGTGLTLSTNEFSISNTAVTAGSYGNGDRVATFTVNSQGQLTAASNVAITANAANLTGTTLNSTIVNSSLTSVGTLGTLSVTGNANVGNIGATNGVFTNVSGNGAALTAIAGANVTGQVGNALVAGTVYTAAQPNITSVGTLTSLNVTGNANVGNIGATNGVFTNVSGNGSALTALNASNISTGTLAQARLANSSLTVNGTAISLGGSATITANTTQTLTLGSYLTGTSFNGGTAVTANVDATTTNTASKVVARDANGSFSANIITATLSGSATSATTAGTVTTAAQPNITSVGTLTGLTIGNATANAVFGNGTITLNSGLITGNGAGLSQLAGANVTGTVANATYAVSAGSAGSATTAGTVTTAAQPNITSVGTLSSLSVTGNASAGNLSTGGTLSVTGNANVGNLGTATAVITTGNITTVNTGLVQNGTSNVTIASGGNVSAFIGGNATAQFVVTSTGANIAGTLNVVGNANVGNIGATNGVFTNVSGNGSALTAITGANVTGTVANATYAVSAGSAGSATTAGTVTTAAQPNITSVGTLTSVAVTGNATAGNVYANSGTIGASLLTGTLTTAAQPNITSVGTLTSLSVTGNASAGNLSTGGSLSVSGNAIITGNLTVNGNVVYVNTETLAVEDPIINLQTGANGAAPTSNSGKDVGTALNYYDTAARVAFMGWDVSNNEFGLASVASITNEVVTFTTYGNLRVGNIIGNGQALTAINGSNVTGTVSSATSATTAGTVTTNAQPNITSVGTLTGLTSGPATFTPSTAPAVDALTPNNGTTGGLRIRGNATSNISYLQFTDAGVSTQWSYLSVANTGVATYSNAFTVSGALTTANITTGANTTAGTITGNWTLTAGSRWQSTYADLAERYQADSNYEPGTVVVLGGEHEVTVEGTADSHKVAGVVTTNPAYIMNLALEGDNVVEVALIGRVPCKVVGPVNKGDLLTTSSVAGHAHANNNAAPGRIIGKALENFDNETGTIEIMVGRT